MIAFINKPETGDTHGFASLKDLARSSHSL